MSTGPHIDTPTDRGISQTARLRAYRLLTAVQMIGIIVGGYLAYNTVWDIAFNIMVTGKARANCGYQPASGYVPCDMPTVIAEVTKLYQPLAVIAATMAVLFCATICWYYSGPRVAPQQSWSHIGYLAYNKLKTSFGWTCLVPSALLAVFTILGGMAYFSGV